SLMPKPLFGHVLNLQIPLRNALLVTQVSSGATVTTQSEVIVADTTSGNVTITLPLSSLSRGRQIVIVKSATENSLIVQRGGSDTIGYAGNLNFTLVARDDKALLIADGGSVWLKILP